MTSPQGGIFSLGTASYAYLEFDRRGDPDGTALARTIASNPGASHHEGGMNLGRRLQARALGAVVPDVTPGVARFDADLRGP
jgi:hypothetical protein